jgi:hypothetical protein
LGDLAQRERAFAIYKAWLPFLHFLHFLHAGKAINRRSAAVWPGGALGLTDITHGTREVS